MVERGGGKYKMSQRERKSKSKDGKREERRCKRFLKQGWNERTASVLP